MSEVILDSQAAKKKLKIMNWKPNKKGQVFDAFLRVEKPHKKHVCSPFVFVKECRTHILAESCFALWCLDFSNFYFKDIEDAV